MAKLTLLLAAIFALLFLVDASVHRTTVIIDDEAENLSTEQRCREQLQRQQNLRQCQAYMMREIRGWGPRAAAVDAEDNDYLRQDPFRMCCQQLQRMDAQCRCDGLRMAIRQQQTTGQLGSREMMSAMRVAQDLPARCGVSPRMCRFSPRWMD